MKLYELTACPYCQMVRRKLAELDLEYEAIEVPRDHALRTIVKEISGQSTVPVFVDNGVILADEEEIVQYLEETYGKKE